MKKMMMVLLLGMALAKVAPVKSNNILWGTRVVWGDFFNILWGTSIDEDMI